MLNEIMKCFKFVCKDSLKKKKFICKDKIDS